MSKTIDSLVQASLDSENFAGVLIARLHFNPILRYATSYQNIYWDEAGAGELEYLGLGNLASLSQLSESSELAAQTIQLKVSGIPNSAITDAFSTEYIGKPVYVWYATLDQQTYAVEGGQAGPVLIFSGRMDYGNITFGDTASITINATSRLADWERSRGGRFNQGYQKVHVDPTDTGFKFVQALQKKAISWGGISVIDNAGAVPSNGGFNGNPNQDR